MSVNTSITTIVGRVLGSPELKLGDPNRKIIKLTVDMEKCHWNLSGRSMVEGKPIEYWGILDFTSCGSYKYKLRGKEFIQKLIVTQCCLSNSANEGEDKFYTNLALKINAKLGGRVDVNHPGYQDTRSPSIAAVVATVNWPAANRYAARVFPQYNRSEKILNFGDVCLELVACYRRMNGVRPERIVIRDGVSTSKPTHYHVLWDKNKFTSDELQKLIYEMCFTFAKCTKPVSLVPSVYYVDLAAYRGRLYREARIGMQSPKSTASSSSKDASSASRTASFELGFYTLHADLENIMFLI
ncbi:Protein argonaute 2 [Glycine soja]|uniref:Protein argonaute 2 n=1 Tax=Glycine soja TaxID=3848 RepID=A0A0B2QSZ7_GLYSO|nr:Protein argonaute 2 [Glycine soja]